MSLDPKNIENEAEKADDNIVADSSGRMLDVLGFIAEKMGRRLIVKNCITKSGNFEVSASFSGVPFAIIGCRGAGPCQRLAEDNAANNFIEYIRETYSLPKVFVDNILQDWDRTETGICQLISVCDLLVMQLESSEYSKDIWVSSDNHTVSNEEKEISRYLRNIVKASLNEKNNEQGPLNNKCGELSSTSSGTISSEPVSKRHKVDTRASVTMKGSARSTKRRKFDVLHFIAEKLGKHLIVHRRPAEPEKLTLSPQFEVSVSFSEVPFAVIGCKSLGPSYEHAEESATSNFINCFQNYFLPGLRLRNIKHNWIGVETDILHLISICNLLVNELSCDEYSKVDWASSDNHIPSSAEKSAAKKLKTTVKMRLDGMYNEQESLKKKCDEIASTSSRTISSEPDSKNPRLFEVLNFIAEKLGRHLIVHRHPAEPEKLTLSPQFEVSVSFSEVPFAVIGCKSLGPSYEHAENSAACNFINFFENYSLPASCLHNIRRNWMNSKTDIFHLIYVCNLLVKELSCAEYIKVKWAPSDIHLPSSIEKSAAKRLKTIVRMRLDGRKAEQWSAKRKLNELPSTTSGSACSEPESKRLKVDASGSVTANDSGIICIDESVLEEPEIFATPVTPCLIERSDTIKPIFYSNVIDHSDQGITTPFPNSSEDQIGVEYSGDANIDLEIQAYIDEFRESCDKLNADIWTHQKYNEQNVKVYCGKMEVRELLLNEIQKIFPAQSLQLHAVGSTINGCGSYNSDMDLCLCIPDEGTSNVYSQNKILAVRYLKKIRDGIKRNRTLKGAVRKTLLIASAKVPILKVEMRAQYNGLELDININNIPGIYNSHLLHYYSLVDARFPTLALLIKHWAITNGISDACTGTFNSYSLILLLIHYLQCGVRPAVLPNLQFLLPSRFSDLSPLNELNLFERLHGIPERPVNLATVGELLMGFFHYYAKFDFHSWAISIRNARRFPRRDLPVNTRKCGMYIEEPFDGTNPAGCIRKMELVNSAFQEASEQFKKQAPDLENISVSV